MYSDLRKQITSTLSALMASKSGGLITKPKDKIKRQMFYALS